MEAQHLTASADQLATAAALSRRIRTLRGYARAMRRGTTIFGETERGCERSARRLEQVVRNMADAILAGRGGAA